MENENPVQVLQVEVRGSLIIHVSFHISVGVIASEGPSGLSSSHISVELEEAIKYICFFVSHSTTVKCIPNRYNPD